jgi:Holliday junction resolvasome RuvABC DNA-binding subunit
MPETHEKLFAALTTLGFRAAPVQRALVELEARAESPMDQLLREAILLLTPARQRR